MCRAAIAFVALMGCGQAESTPQTLGDPVTAGDASTSTGTADAAESSTASTGAPDDAPPPPWAPGVVYPSTRELDERGFVDLRGPIHTHSPYSWDACDEMPRDASGELNAACVQDLRRDLCLVQHDFAFFTDHRDSFDDSEFPDVLLFDPSRGDTLVDRGGDPVASWAACDGVDDGTLPTLVMAGCEVPHAAMPVGLEGHAPGRGDTYGSLDPTAIAEMRDAGAVLLVAHPEDFEVDELVALPVDGFEMYNVHANLLINLPAMLTLLEQLAEDPRALPHPDLLLLPLFTEDDRYLERWGTVLARGGRPVTTMASDAHQNTLREHLPDGERADSFRRILQSFSNHLRVQPEPDGTWDDRHLKQALAARRLYGVFEYLGYAEGFDAFMQSGEAIWEIGDVAAWADAPEIVVHRPRLRGLDPEATPPDIELRVLAAREGGFDVVAQSTESQLRYPPRAPGAYRVEVRIAPKHLSGWLGSYEDAATAWRVWIYANAFFITP